MIYSVCSCLKNKRKSPLTLISSLLSLLQLLKGCCQSLLSSVKLFLHKLDASVEGSYFCLSLSMNRQMQTKLVPSCPLAAYSSDTNIATNAIINVQITSLTTSGYSKFKVKQNVLHLTNCSFVYIFNFLHHHAPLQSVVTVLTCVICF